MGFKLHLRADEANGHHTTFSVFMNGANCGQLKMTEAEAVFFHDVILQSRWIMPDRDEVVASGRWIHEKD